MYSTAHIDPDKPPKVTRFLNKQPLCGLCQFKCCNSPSLHVECTPKEAENLQLPILFQQDGQCRCLTDKGCKHGVERPVFCRMFPLQVTKDNQLVLAYWSILNCPMASDYTLVSGYHDREVGQMRYKYKRKKVSGAKRNNSDEFIEIPEPLTEFPTVLENNYEALVSLYGDETAHEILRHLERLNVSDKGLGLV